MVVTASCKALKVAVTVVYINWAGNSDWLQEAFSRHFLRDVDVEQVQMDELFTLLSAVKDGEISERQAIKRLSHSPHWYGSRWTPCAS